MQRKAFPSAHWPNLSTSQQCLCTVQPLELHSLPYPSSASPDSKTQNASADSSTWKCSAVRQPCLLLWPALNASALQAVPGAIASCCLPLKTLVMVCFTISLLELQPRFQFPPLKQMRIVSSSIHTRVQFKFSSFADAQSSIFTLYRSC